MIQALVDLGIDEIFSVEPDVSNREALRRLALEKALLDARETAELMTGKLGATLGRVHQIGNRETSRGLIEEIVVTATSRGPERIEYVFRPGPIEVRSSVYVEFTIE